MAPLRLLNWMKLPFWLPPLLASSYSSNMRPERTELKAVAAGFRFQRKSWY
jgi:hypothetical protein